jgi:phosphoglycerate dehydrogenase-like enzyme
VTDLLVVDALEPEVLEWLSARLQVHSDPALARQPMAFRRHLAQARAVILPAHLPLDAATLRDSPRLQAIGRLSPAVDQIDLGVCATRGIELVRPSRDGVVAEAEFIVGSLLQMLRRVPVISAEGLLVGRELGSCRVGIIGMSAAAKPLADLLKAFGARVVGYDPGLHASDPQWRSWGIAHMGLRELMAECDGVCVLLNYFSRYRGLLGERYLSACRRDQVLVNLSSALILQENALADALRSGRMAAAWLDHVDARLLAPGGVLHGLDSLQVTPRVAGATLEAHLRAAWDVAGRLDQILSETSPGGLKPPSALGQAEAGRPGPGGGVIRRGFSSRRAGGPAALGGAPAPV